MLHFLKNQPKAHIFRRAFDHHRRPFAHLHVHVCLVR